MTVRGQWNRGVGHPPGATPELLFYPGLAIQVNGNCYNLDAGPHPIANATGVDALLFNAAGPTDNVVNASGNLLDSAAAPTDSVEPEDGFIQSPSVPVTNTVTVTNT